MLTGKRAQLVGWACAVGVSVVLAGCGSSGGTKTARTRNTASARVVPGPAGTLGAAPPQPSGLMWLLNRHGRARDLTEVALSAGTVSRIVPTSGSAAAVAESPIGVIAVGLATATTGAVELRNASTGAQEVTIPVAAPVLSLAYAPNGTTLYVLEGARGTRSVSVINAERDKVLETVGLPADASAIAPAITQNAVWTVQRSGTVQETSLSTRKPEGAFSVGAPGIAIEISPDGGVLYVLKGAADGANISVVNASTQTTERVLPAARNSVGLQISNNGKLLYDLVGTPGYGNIQIIDL
jgi:DNA-binding beta-propeller fold protein YncE